MKRYVVIFLSLALCLAMTPMGGLAEEGMFGPGLSRGTPILGYDMMQNLARKYGLSDEEIDWKEPAAITDWYKPADPKPMNAYMVTSLDCEVGINKDDMYTVREKGLHSSITKYLNEWAGEIEAASHGAIRFVDDPDQADILISARQLYKFYANYSGGGYTTKGYSSEVTFFAYHLSDSHYHYSVKKTLSPGKSTSLSGHPSKFWKNPPEFENSLELDELVGIILSWYGKGFIGTKNDGVIKARGVLIDRGYLEGSQDDVFDADMETAVKRLQRDYGLKETGIIDPVTLVALYYDKAAVEEQMAKYSAPAAE